MELKLIDILKLMSFDTYVIIYDVNHPDDEPLFKGNSHNVPWTLVDCKIDSDPDEEGAIYTCNEKNDYGVIISYIIIYIEEV